jgi:hypothetical protein
MTALRHAQRYRLAAALLFLACFVVVGSRYSEAEIKDALKAYQIESGPIFSIKWRD